MTSLDANLNAANRRFAFNSGAYPKETTAKFAVVNMTGTEAISQTFSFDLVLVCDDTNIDFEKMLSNPATLSIFSAVGAVEVKYHGVLSEVEQLHQAGNHVFYRVVLAPKLHRLNLFRTSDVYLGEQTIPSVLEAVIKSSGLTSSDFEKKLVGIYRHRDFVCQYQETNLNFISRWMEKEGIYYFFDHSGSSEKLLLVDAVSMQPAPVERVTYRPLEELTTGVAFDSVQNFVCRQKPLPNQVILQGFNYNSAAVELRQIAPVSDSGAGDVMLYGENFLDDVEGQRYAKIRSEEILCKGKVFSGDATAVGLRSGHCMQMAGHYRSDFNSKYLVTEIDHFGSQAGVLLAGIGHPFGGKSGETDYHIKFRAIDFNLQYRPARAMIRPHIGGTVSAIIDAEGSGQYAEVDEFGKYKVQLPFSTSGKRPNQGSARIRMATPYSGSGYGMHFPLHKGAEVLLSFIDGDPDQPVIMSAAPNSENLSVVNNKNPSVHMLKTAGGNSLMFEDKQRQERINLYSPTFKTGWRLGAATAITAPVDAPNEWSLWGVNKQGLHGHTEASLGLDVKKTAVVKVGETTKLPLYEPAPGQVQVQAGSALINIDNTQSLVDGGNVEETTTGVLDIYAKHINMYAEPSEQGGTLKYGYIMKSGDPKQGAGNAWGFGDLYALQNFTTDYNASLQDKAGARMEVLSGSKTSFTQGHSNAATYGDCSSLTHGNNIKLVHGTDQSHTYGMSSSMFYGMKNDLTVGATNSVFIGTKTDTSAAAKLTMALSAAVSLSVGAEFKASLSATLEIAAGIKTGVNTVADVSVKAIEAKAAATQLVNSVAIIANRTMVLQNEANRLETSVFRLQLAAANIFT